MNFNKFLILSSLVLLFLSYFLRFLFYKLVTITLKVFCLWEILSFSQLWYIVIRQYILHVCCRPLLNAQPYSSISNTQKEVVVVGDADLCEEILKRAISLRKAGEEEKGADIWCGLLISEGICIAFLERERKILNSSSCVVDFGIILVLHTFLVQSIDQ